MRILFFIFLILCLTKIDSYGSQVKKIFQGHLTKIIEPSNGEHESELFNKLKTATISISWMDKKNKTGGEALIHLKDGTPIDFCNACGSVEHFREAFDQKKSLLLVFYKEELNWMEFIDKNISLMEYDDAVHNQRILDPNWNPKTRRDQFSPEKTISIKLQ